MFATVTTTTTNGPLEAADTDDYQEHDVKHQAILRAQQRARAFISQTAPQSPVSSLPQSPTGSPTQTPHDERPDGLWNTPLTPNKSQDAVKSSLKGRPRLARANSEPPQKSVHFSTTNLVDVRQFRRTQKPCAVSKGMRKQHLFFLDSGEEGSLTDDNAAAAHGVGSDDYDDDDDDDDDNDDYDEFSEDAIDNDDEEDDEGFRRMPRLRRHSRLTSSRHDENEVKKGWTLLTPHFVPYAHGHIPGPQRPMCYLETLQLSPSQGNLRASVYVRNVSYNKYVVLRYSINNWASYGETQGVWTSDIRKFDRDAGYDRFDVSISLDQFPSYQLNQSSMELCARYVAEGHGEFWDNNGGKNYEIFLRNSKVGTQKPETSGRPVPAARPRMGSVPIAFGHDDDLETSYSSLEHLKLSGLPMRRKEDIKARDPFVDRYSFESSYKAPPKSSHAAGLYKGAPVFAIKDGQIVTSAIDPERADLMPVELKAARETAPSLIGKSTRVFNTSNSTERLANGWDSDSYNEFVSKYCFYTPTRTAPAAAPAAAPAPTAPTDQPSTEK